MRQKEATFNVVISMLNEKGIKYDGGVGVRGLFTADDEKKMAEKIAEGIKRGEIEFSDKARAKYDTDKKVLGYAMALLSNSFRKDVSLNGGEKYVPKNPGSRVKDEQLASLKALLKTQADNPEVAAKIAEAIATRQNELKAEKSAAKTTEINMEVVPEEIKALLK